MGIRERVAAWLAPDPPAAPVEERRLTSWDLLRIAGAGTGGGSVVVGADGRLLPPTYAENLAAVACAVQAIGSAIASLPAWVYVRTERGRAVDEAHPVQRLVRRGPNPHQTWPDFLEAVLADTLLSGNGVAEVIADGRGAPVELRPIPWGRITLELLPDGRPRYAVDEPAGGTRRLLAPQVLHLKDRSDDGGLTGTSRLRRCAATIALALSQQAYAESVARQGGFPSGAIKAAGHLTGEAAERLRQRVQEVGAGASNAGKILLLDQGLDWTSIRMSPEDEELLASRRLTIEELARVFNIPPPIIGDYSHNTFTNAETAGRWFAQHTLAPWIRKIEAEFVRSVFSEASRATHELEIDMSGFLRGDPEVRWKSHEIAVRSNILTVDEIRGLEGWDPRPEGE